MMMGRDTVGAVVTCNFTLLPPVSVLANKCLGNCIRLHMRPLPLIKYNLRRWYNVNIQEKRYEPNKFGLVRHAN